MATETLQISTESVDDARDLRGWLSDERSKEWKISENGAPQPGELGAAETLQIVLDSGGLIALVKSIHVWIKYRQPRVKVKIRSKSGKEVIIDATNAGNVEDVVNAIKNV
jgi:hypothetical protein